MSLLGDDGRGFELARKLESLGVWRSWLGESLYTAFVHSLSSPSSWDSFMSSKSQIHLQLRARALLFDKASVSLFLHSNSPSNSNSNSSTSTTATAGVVSKLNPNYLQLHGDDVYFTLEGGDSRREGGAAAPNATSLMTHSKSTFTGSRFTEPEADKLSQRFRNEELPETWYNQFIEKYKISKPYRLSLGDRDSEKRSPEEMANYLRLLERHKRRRVAFRQDKQAVSGSSAMESNTCNSIDEDVSLLPETMFISNCVPDSAFPPIVREQSNQKMEFGGVLDMLTQTRNTVVIERLGISVEQGGSVYRGKSSSEGNRKHLGEEQALHMSKKVIARMLNRVGFDSGTEVPVEVFSQLLSCHICKLGRILKILSDSYRKQCSAFELLKMFLQTVGHSNVMNLMELVKDGTRTVVQPTQQLPSLHGIQSQFQTQHQNALRLPQQIQIPRQMHPQMQQMMAHSQNLALQQQQLERMRRRQPPTPTPRPGMDMDKDRPLVQVKVENPPELPMDNNAFNSIHARQMQLRQQQIAAMTNLHAQSGNQLRQVASMQVPQVQSPNMGIVRAPPVKVEGFSELMGGDSNSTFKHDSEENRLTSPK
ncbi:hypothetical protein K2173_026102 [Erythroxylum novogranatense]|uniref:Bromodomain associated domain-containing protein n=1 Tax=Erythroxylum novogranatense TaxID=1862640 RepID=A0AAV8TYG2_9ROSI|nr:hypothetical protein K2173_026102 [Erythroxylum novogranatense]